MISIPVSKPDLGGNEEKYALDAIKSSWISSTGPYVDRFEREFAARCGAADAVSVCNGTAALHLALLALGIGPGDEVIVPAMTFVATGNAVLYCGATPVIVDVEEDTWCISTQAVREAITKRTKAIIAVHLFGHPADMPVLRTIADEFGLVIVEDAAQAHFAGVHMTDRVGVAPVGSLGDLATFSFYGNKIITSGEGGAVVDSSGRYAERLRLLRGQAMSPGRQYFHTEVGYNYRLTNVACAILCAQLERADELVVMRHAVRRQYWDMFIGWDHKPKSAVVMQRYMKWASPVPWMVGVVFPSRRRRELVEAALRDIQVETRPFFAPLNLLPSFKEMGRPKVVSKVTWHSPRWRTLNHHVAWDLRQKGLCLPTHPGLSLDDIERIVACVLEAIA